MNQEEIEVFYPTSRTEWRLWLQKNHNLKPSVWLVFYGKSSKKPSISWSEAVDVALCFGWIDSIAVAKQNCSWTILDEVEDLIIPYDLEKAFKKHQGSKAFFQSLSK
jgi:uncharacterized protein YdeI (YjbR/CyaY-like superfamily)